MMKSEDYKRGYNAGYKQALLDALRQKPESHPRMGGPDAPYKQGNYPHSLGSKS
jgi:hypothetical protein